MCQAYSGERSSIINEENLAIIAGFKAAIEGKPTEANPHIWLEYARKAWDHGWHCFQIRLLPWAIEQKLPLHQRAEAQREFRQKGELPSGI